jgi:hypothetical protein
MPSSSTRDHDHERRALDREIDRLQRTLDERGELSRAALREAAGARYWGPGRFRHALKQALRRHAINASGRRRYGPS